VTIFEDHPVAYDGAKVGAQQRKAYPDLAPLILKAPRDEVFAAAQGVLASMGLELVAADAAQGRIEAIATSLLFGFKDDVVVRIASAPNGTTVDIRSMSRVGLCARVASITAPAHPPPSASDLATE